MQSDILKLLIKEYGNFLDHSSLKSESKKFVQTLEKLTRMKVEELHYKNKYGSLPMKYFRKYIFNWRDLPYDLKCKILVEYLPYHRSYDFLEKIGFLPKSFWKKKFYFHHGKYVKNFGIIDYKTCWETFHKFACNTYNRGCNPNICLSDCFDFTSIYFKYKNILTPQRFLTLMHNLFKRLTKFSSGLFFSKSSFLYVDGKVIEMRCRIYAKSIQPFPHNFNLIDKLS
jgi:hypothetical protein